CSIEAGICSQRNERKKLLNARILDLLYVKRFKCRMTKYDCSRGAERHAEFRFERSRRPAVNQQARCHRIDLNIDTGNVISADIMRALQIEQRIERWMRRGAGGIELNGNPCIQDFPARPQIGRGFQQSRWRLLAVHGREITLRAIETLLTCDETGL